MCLHIAHAPAQHATPSGVLPGRTLKPIPDHILGMGMRFLVFGSLAFSSRTQLWNYVVRVQIVRRKAERLAGVFASKVSSDGSIRSSHTKGFLRIRKVEHLTVLHSKIRRDTTSGDGVAARTWA